MSPRSFKDNIKRMLAYSSIAHAGYVLMGMIAVGLGSTVDTREYGLKAVLLYLLIYTFVNFGAFALVIILRREQVAGDRVADFAGLSRRAPWAAFAMLVFMLSLAGIPATPASASGTVRSGGEGELRVARRGRG